MDAKILPALFGGKLFFCCFDGHSQEKPQVVDNFTQNELSLLVVLSAKI